MFEKRIKLLLTTALSVLPLFVHGTALGESIVLQSTTSTANSGLYEYLLPKFEEKTGIKVNVVAVGTGQALKNAANGDGDVVLVHSKPDEERFVAEGYGVERFDVMYNDFVLVGPSTDPAGIRNSANSADALGNIADTQAYFTSRGDNSGTHKKEIQLWNLAKIDPLPDSGDWYRETGAGMGATLNIAVGIGAYALTDRGSWISFKNKKDFEVLFAGDSVLQNQYGVILVDQNRHSHVRKEQGQKFVDWIVSEEGQTLISNYTLEGQQLFFPNAKQVENQ